MNSQRFSRCSCSPCQVSNLGEIHGNTLSLPSLINHSTIEGVSPERQKVMIGGTTLSDDDWGKAKSKIKEVCMKS